MASPLAELEVVWAAGRPEVAPHLLPAIDGQDFAGDKLTRGTGQVDAAFDDVPDVPWAAHGVALVEGLAARLGILREAAALHRTDAEAVYPDTQGCPFYCHRLRQVDYSGARRRRMRHVRQSAIDRGGDIHDVACLVAISPAPGGGLHHVPCAVQIGVDDGFPALDGEINCRLRKLPASVVDEHIEATVSRPHALHEGLHLVRLANVHRHRVDVAAEAAQQGARGFEFLRLAAAQNEISTQSREQNGDRLADAAASA